jgi:phosphate transport system protein
VDIDATPGVVVTRPVLDDLDQPVLELFAMVSEGLAAATSAFLSDDREAARAVVAAEQDIDSLESRIEDLIDQQLACGPDPRALRQLLAVLRIVPELERSGDLVEHIALRTPQGMAKLLSPRARMFVQDMGEVGVEMWRGAADAYARRDAATAERLRSLDDRLDDLHVSLSCELGQSVIATPVAIEMGLVARFLERLGDHAVNVARRVRDLSDSALVEPGRTV